MANFISQLAKSTSLRVNTSSPLKKAKYELSCGRKEVKGEARARGRVGEGRTVVSGEIRATVSKHVVQSLSVREAGQSSV